MEQHGLEQLIGALKSRGIKAGEEEAVRLVAEARAKAEDLLADARREADDLRGQAAAEAAATRAALESELRQATRVGVVAFREAIEQGFVVPEIDALVKAALARPALVEEAIAEMVRSFAGSGLASSDLEVILPEARKDELGSALLAHLAARGAEGVRVKHDPSLSFGFRIGPAGSGFSFDLSEEAFRDVLARFVAPRFRATFYSAAKPK